MTVLIGDVVRVTQEMHYLTLGSVQNVYHLENISENLTDAGALSDLIEILEDLATLLTLLIAAAQVVDGIRAVNVTQHTDVGFGQFVDDTPFTGGGTVAAKQVALGVNLHTRTLGVFGRKYFGATPTAVAGDGGVISGTYLTALGLVGGYMASRISATNSQWDFGVIKSLDSSFEYFNAYSLPLTAITQRRRRAGVGI